jgi:hypothetical protein
VDTHTLIRLVVGLGMTAVVLVFAARRVLWLTNLIRSGQKTSDEHGRKDELGTRIKTQITEVFGQTRLLKWSIPGLAHFFTMWGFFILATVYLEAYGLLFVHDFHIPFVGRWDALGFLQDFIALSVLAGITTFAIIRLRTEPKEHGRESRFYGSHTGGAWLILFMIFNVIWTYALVRGSAVNTDNLPYGNGAFFSQFMGWVLHPLGHTANEWIETVALLLHIGVMLVFLLIVLHSKHLHIGLAPLNVTFKRLPNALGPLLPVEFKGEPIDFEDPAEDAVLGRGKIEDFTWKGYLDFTVPMPGMEYRKAALPQARHHEPARPPVREGAIHPRRQGNSAGEHPRGWPGRELGWREARRRAPRPRVGFRTCHGLGPGAGHPPAGRHCRAARRDRPRRVVVVHHLRRVRRTVPGGHRAHRPHR